MACGCNKSPKNITPKRRVRFSISPNGGKIWDVDAEKGEISDQQVAEESLPPQDQLPQPPIHL